MPETEKANHLIHEKSPYLLQHARNPVDWHPWGEEAFAQARREDKPILVSIGYSTCHWCHVMERESFSNPAIAELMNRDLVCIKVDREERPDVDKIYMTAAMVLTGAGGWPLNVFLTPDLKPFYGGTYFPPDERWGRMSWPQLVERIGASWKDPENRKKILASADGLTRHLSEYLSGKSDGEAPDLDALMEAGFSAFRNDFDPHEGGFGGAPKFPMPVNLEFLFRYWTYARGPGRDPNQAGAALEMALTTLRKMARGGVFDQLGGGFHRYSVDELWRVPHFEKMLYDNAQLACAYLDAYQITREPFFARVARETLDYVLRDMTHPDGGFFSAEDADSLPAGAAPGHKSEGAFYLWERAEVLDLLGPEAGEIFCHYYGVQAGGNAPADPQGEFRGKNVLYAARSLAETALQFGETEEETEKILKAAREKLFAVRARRPRPHLDDKVIASWNGLMVSACARGYQVLNDERYLITAKRAAGFVLSRLYDSPSRQLYRRWREDDRAVRGTSDDYAFMAQGLVDLYEADFEVRWRDWALELAVEMNRRFYDPGAGGYFMTESGHDGRLILRVKEESDNVEPNASSVAALTLLRLSQFIDDPDFPKPALKTLEFFSRSMREAPRALPAMLSAAAFALGEPKQIVILGDPKEAGTQELLRELRGRFLPDKAVALADRESTRKKLALRAPFLGTLTPIQGKPTAYVCVGRACRLPTNDPAAFGKFLDDGH